jgi:hypothetical protein
MDSDSSTLSVRWCACVCAVLGTEYVISLSAYNKAGDGQPIYETVTTREETGECYLVSSADDREWFTMLHCVLSIK